MKDDLEQQADELLGEKAVGGLYGTVGDKDGGIGTPVDDSDDDESYSEADERIDYATLNYEDREYDSKPGDPTGDAGAPQQESYSVSLRSALTDSEYEHWEAIRAGETQPVTATRLGISQGAVSQRIPKLLVKVNAVRVRFGMRPFTTDDIRPLGRQGRRR